MILQGRQVTRFLKLFDSLVAFCVDDLQVPGVIVPDDDSLDGPDLWKTVNAVWGEQGDRSAIERYVKANPDGLNRTDLREVESWKLGLCKDFAVTRDGSNVYFMLARYAFAVRGLDYEVDDDLEYVPAYVSTLLLPFDGLITYGLYLDFTYVRLEYQYANSVEMLLDECKEKGHVARTARQFIQSAPLAVEDAKKLVQESLELLGDVPQLGPGTHEGALAGLSVEGRRKAIADYLDERNPLPADHFVHVFDHRSYACSPKATFREFLAAQSVKDLRHLMERLDIDSSSARGGKGQIVREIMDAVPFEFEEIAGTVLMAGTRAAEGFRDVLKAGGAIVVPDSEVTSLDALPQPIMPYLMLFHDRGEFCAQIFQEAKDELFDTDAADLVEKARAIDTAIDYVSLAVDFRGAVRIADVVNEAADVLGLDYLDSTDARLSVVMVIRARLSDGILDYIAVTHEDKLYFTADALLDVDDMEPLDDEGEERMAFVLDDQDAYEPRPVADLIGAYGDAFEWMESTPEFSALVGFLDTHVPDGASDYSYADEVLEEVFDCSRFVYDAFIDDALDILAGQSYVPADDEEREQAVRLLSDFYEATPKWQLNGWSLKELGQG